MLIPRFGTLDKIENRRTIMETWLRSKGFRRAHLDPNQLMERALEAQTGGHFLRVVMEAIAQNQGVDRWAVYDPDNVLYIPRIKTDIPEALFIHIIRDGRDIALSLKKMGGFSPLPWDRGSTRSLLATAMYWEWMVRKGRQYGGQIPGSYIEVHYEELVRNPRSTLATLGEFLQHDLDYDRIQSSVAVLKSNSSFLEEEKQDRANPVQRWKERLSNRDVAAIEALVGPCLEEFGYPLTAAQSDREPGLKEKWMRASYPFFLETKLALKIRTPLGRLANLSALELADAAPHKDLPR